MYYEHSFVWIWEGGGGRCSMYLQLVVFQPTTGCISTKKEKKSGIMVYSNNGSHEFNSKNAIGTPSRPRTLNSPHSPTQTEPQALIISAFYSCIYNLKSVIMKSYQLRTVCIFGYKQTKLSSSFTFPWTNLVPRVLSLALRKIKP